MPDANFTKVPSIEKATVGKQTFFQRIFKIEHFLIISGGAFIVLAFLSRNIPYFQFDLIITKAIQGVTVPGFNFLMVQLTNLGNPIMASISVIIVGLILFMLKKKTAAIISIISTIGLSAIGIFFKDIVARPRPASSLVNQLVHFVKPDSFPSGHVLQFMGLYGFVFVFIFTTIKMSRARTVLLILLLLLIVGIGFSRIYVGAHWFSDVLGSYLIGTVWLYFMTLLYNKYEKKGSKNL